MSADDHAGRPGLFIFSDTRSGSTLLRYILDTHREICCPPELYLGGLCEDLFWALYYSLAQTIDGCGEEDKERFVLKDVRRIVGELMNSYAKAKNKSVWCEKSPANLRHLDLLQRVFPDAKFICLYRNCMDVVHSQIEANRLGWSPQLARYVHKNPDNIVAALIESWVDNAERLTAFERKNTSSCLRITYESLVREPTETLNGVFAFLQLHWDSGLLDAVFSTRHDVGNGDAKVIYSSKISSASIGKGSMIMGDRLSLALRDRLNKLFEELGYSVTTLAKNDTESLYPASAKTREETEIEIRRIFASYFSGQLNRNKDQLRGVKSICRFVVTGDGSGSWMIDLADGKLSIADDAGDAQADCTVTVVGRDLIELTSGTMNPGEAYLQGRLSVTGDLELAAKVGQILFLP